MPKVSPYQGNFSTGEISPLFFGRTDADRYKSALQTCLNYIPTLQGGLVRRPGSEFINEASSVGAFRGRLIRFIYSKTQAYVLEFSHLAVRFYKNGGVVKTVSNAVYYLDTPYTAQDLAQLTWTQSADVLYLAHPTYGVSKLIRYGDADWSLVNADFQDGPYLPTGVTDYMRVPRPFTITPSAATGSVTLTSGPTITIVGAVADATNRVQITAVAHGFITGDGVYIAAVGGVTGINSLTWVVERVDADHFILKNSTFVGAYTAGGTAKPALFDNSAIGRPIRLLDASTWGWGKVTAVANSTSCTLDVKSTLSSTTAKTTWRLGVSNGATLGIAATPTGGPLAITFHEDRLMLLGLEHYPQSFWGSRTGDYENFSPSDMTGTITSSHAVNFTLNSDDVNAIRWGISDEKGLVAGTSASEWVIKSASANEAISPTSITAKQSTYIGSARVTPVKAGKASVYIQGDSRKVREVSYFYDTDGFRSTDVSLLAEHITKTGIIEMAYQKSPHSLIWCVRNDGVLSVLTYDRDVDGLRAGWSRHVLGGTGDQAGNAPIVENIAAIPSDDGSSDEIWMIVKRWIGGAAVRYVERIKPFFNEETAQKDAFFLDSGLTYDAPKTVTAVTKANPAVVTSAAHGFANGDRVRFYDMVGMTELDDNIYTIANVTANTFELLTTDSSAYGVFISGTVRKLVTTITGLDHLIGETVGILADGAVQPDQVVSGGGSIVLATAAAVVHVGYNYNSDGQLPRINAGAADGTSLGKTRRTHRVGFLFDRSLNLLVGPSFTDLTRMIFRESSDSMDSAPPLFTGIKSEEFETDYDFENLISWRQDQPLPSTVLAVLPQMVEQDR